MKISLIIAFLISLAFTGCTNTKQSISSAIEPTSTPEIIDYHGDNIGTLDLKSGLYTIEMQHYLTKYSDCKLKVVFHVITEKDDTEPNVYTTQLRITNIEFDSIEIISGWDTLEFKEITSIEYEDFNQRALVYWTYEGTVDGEKLTENDFFTVDLY